MNLEITLMKVSEVSFREHHTIPENKLNEFLLKMSKRFENNDFILGYEKYNELIVWIYDGYME